MTERQEKLLDEIEGYLILIGGDRTIELEECRDRIRELALVCADNDTEATEE